MPDFEKRLRILAGWSANRKLSASLGQSSQLAKFAITLIFQQFPNASDVN